MSEKFTLTKIKKAISERCKDCGGDINTLCKSCYLHEAPTLDNIMKNCKDCCNRNNPVDTCGEKDCPLYPIMLTLFESKLEVKNEI